MKIIQIILLGLLTTQCIAQSVKVGEWRDHLSYNSTYDICKLGNKIYTSTDRAIFTYDQNDNSVERLNTLNGLSDIGVSAIESNDKTLLIGYENGNLDLITNGGTHNLSDIKRANIIADKTINSINIQDDLAYLSCGFGIVVIDIQREEIKDTYYIGQEGSYTNIHSTAIAHNHIYATTDSGIVKANITATNLANYEAWEKVSFRENDHFNVLESFNNIIFANLEGETYKTDTVYKYDGTNWSIFREPYTTVSIKSIDEKLTVCSPFGVTVYDKNLNQTHYISSSKFELEKNNFRAALFSKNHYWIADQYNGLLHYDNTIGESILPSGPINSDVAQIKNFGEEIWLAHGAKNENWDPTWAKNEVSILKNDFWEATNSMLENEIWDIVAINQDQNKTYVASWQKGLVELDYTEWNMLYDETNSSLQSRAEHNDWTNIGAIEFDSEGNMWCTNSQTEKPLSVKYTAGDWEAFSLGSSVTEKQNIAKLLIDRNDQKWIQLRNNGMVVFDEKRSGTKTRKLSNSESDGNLASDRVYSFAEDLDGEIWVGTDNGISVFYNPESIFEGENASQIIVSLGEHNQNLLDGQRINDIEIDGANRKWFATNNSGVIVTSENGTEEIHHFTTENSPLFSNKVVDIEFNDLTGEVFFATDKGLISFRSGATKGNSTFSNILAFPNPVKPDYEGLITIKGLITNAVVKITDISGNLIYETTALGGQAVWDGKSFDGERAHSGVYLIFCSDEDGNITQATKLLFIKG